MTRDSIFLKLKGNKRYRNFSLFVLIGALKAAISVLLSWLIIDIMRVPSLIASAFIVSLVFLLIYSLYVRLNVIKPKFLKYLGATIFFNITTIVFVWISVDFLHFSGALSFFIIICLIFVLKYLFLDKVGVINYGEMP